MPREGEEAGDAWVVGAEVVDEHAGDGLDVERAGCGHLLEVGPILRPVEERLEHGEVAAGEERDVVAGEGFPSDALADVGVERRRAEEHVDGRVGPPEAGLTVGLELPRKRRRRP